MNYFCIEIGRQLAHPFQTGCVLLYGFCFSVAADVLLLFHQAGTLTARNCSGCSTGWLFSWLLHQSHVGILYIWGFPFFSFRGCAVTQNTNFCLSFIIWRSLSNQKTPMCCIQTNSSCLVFILFFCLFVFMFWSHYLDKLCAQKGLYVWSLVT